MTSEKNYFVYVLRCSDDSLYTGITTDVSRRLDEHNQGPASKQNPKPKGAKYTQHRTPVRLVYSVRYKNRSHASQEECRIKSLTRSEKLILTGLA